jgi:hypothetical protein
MPQFRPFLVEISNITGRYSERRLVLLYEADKNNQRSIMSPDEAAGEITSLSEGPLHASSLEDCVGVEARMTEESYGDPADDKAIGNIAASLARKPSFHSASAENLQEKAESLYVLLCQQVSVGTTQEQLQKIAALFGESPGKLLQRLA